MLSANDVASLAQPQSQASAVAQGVASVIGNGAAMFGGGPAGRLGVEPETITAAATELELLADRLAAAHAAAGPATHVLPSGAEEVSMNAATHLNAAAGMHDASMARGIFELQNAAATLRAQLAAYTARDCEHAAGIAAQTSGITAV